MIKMKSSFLDYYKLILDKVSFDPELLKKEYQKALRVLDKSEAKRLDNWMHKKGLDRKVKLVHPLRQQKVREDSKAY